MEMLSTTVPSAQPKMLCAIYARIRRILQKSVGENPLGPRVFQLLSGHQLSPQWELLKPKRSTATVVVNSDWSVEALFDSGSNESYIHPSLVDVPAIPVHSSASMVPTAT